MKIALLQNIHAQNNVEMAGIAYPETVRFSEDIGKLDCIFGLRWLKQAQPEKKIIDQPLLGGNHQRALRMRTQAKILDYLGTDSAGSRACVD